MTHKTENHTTQQYAIAEHYQIIRSEIFLLGVLYNLKQNGKCKRNAMQKYNRH